MHPHCAVQHCTRERVNALTLVSNNYIFLLMSVLQIRCVNKIFCIVLTSQPGIFFSCCFQTSCQKIRTSLLINKTANPGQKAQVMPPTIHKIIPLPFVSGNISLGTYSVERRYLLWKRSDLSTNIFEEVAEKCEDISINHDDFRVLPKMTKVSRLYDKLRVAIIWLK